jgi:hypothetical protein
MPAPQPRYRQPKQLDAGSFQPQISSFRLHLAAEGKAAKTIRTYTEAVAWFAAHLPREVGLTRRPISATMTAASTGPMPGSCRIAAYP